MCLDVSSNSSSWVSMFRHICLNLPPIQACVVLHMPKVSIVAFKLFMNVCNPYECSIYVSYIVIFNFVFLAGVSLHMIAPVSEKQSWRYGWNCSALSWWRHQMGTFSALLGICAGKSPVPGEFPSQRPVTRSFDVFLDLRPNKRLSKHSWGWCFETPLSPIWRHCNDGEENHNKPQQSVTNVKNMHAF